MWYFEVSIVIVLLRFRDCCVVYPHWGNLKIYRVEWIELKGADVLGPGSRPNGMHGPPLSYGAVENRSNLLKIKKTQREKADYDRTDGKHKLQNAQL